MKTSKSSQVSLGLDVSTSSLADFLANRTLQSVSGEERPTIDISGRKCTELSERFAPLGSWQRTFAGFLVGMTGLYSTRCSMRFTVKATKSSRPYFLLLVRPLAHTKGTASGLLLTPTATERAESPESMWERSRKAGYRNGTKWSSLLSQVLYGDFLPTPVAWDGTGGGARILKDGKPTTGKGYSPRLKDLARNGMLPTPTATDFKGAYPPSSLDNNPARRNLLRNVYHLEPNHTYDGQTSQLNPRFVAEMMGFPPNWTELPFQSGDESQ
tara:strand:- start:291 stop:1100 length:810 start_codon:yes stop_codon:yes gene_type:complete